MRSFGDILIDEPHWVFGGMAAIAGVAVLGTVVFAGEFPINEDDAQEVPVVDVSEDESFIAIHPDLTEDLNACFAANANDDGSVFVLEDEACLRVAEALAPAP